MIVNLGSSVSTLGIEIRVEKNITEKKYLGIKIRQRSGYRIKGRIKNKSEYKTYEKVEIWLNFYSGSGRYIHVKEYVMKEIIYPGQELDFELVTRCEFKEITANIVKAE